MLLTSNTCNFVVNFPKMTSDFKGKAIVLMGSYACLLRTIGQMLGRAVHGPFLDADDYHSDANKEKMKNGIPLSEEDRVPWLEALRNTLRRGLVDNETLVLACSALQKRYREILRSADPNYEPGSYASIVKFVLLDVGAEVLAARLVKRAAEGKHFMSAKLLQTQLDLLQIDEAEGILTVDATQNPDDINHMAKLLDQSTLYNGGHVSIGISLPLQETFLVPSLDTWD
ncbi:hypothetical protein CQW23_23109 [Capsicum baccatum]|uniref:Gluconokinase n=1 Tax=Capsicum baccatum TaxID=33114 RepID=A0A2G2VR02_CAPBA|nr:hypothetical protein CQW23_23109 [Capsicum baccatum]